MRIEPEQVARWEQFLADFEREVMPVFRRQGIGREAALMAWMMDRATNALLDEDDDWPRQREPWE